MGRSHRSDILDTKVNPCHFVAVPDSSNVLYPVDFREINVGSDLVLAEDEVRPVFFEVGAFRESDAVVFGVVFEPVCFERDRTLWPGVTVFAVAGRIRLVVCLSQIEPRLESIRKFFDDFLTGLCIQVFPAGLVLHVRFERSFVWDFACCVPDTVGCPACDVPDFRGGVSERIEAIADLSLVLDGTNVGVRDPNRHT